MSFYLDETAKVSDESERSYDEVAVETAVVAYNAGEVLVWLPTNLNSEKSYIIVLKCHFRKQFYDTCKRLDEPTLYIHLDCT